MNTRGWQRIDTHCVIKALYEMNLIQETRLKTKEDIGLVIG